MIGPDGVDAAAADISPLPFDGGRGGRRHLLGASLMAVPEADATRSTDAARADAAGASGCSCALEGSGDITLAGLASALLAVGMVLRGPWRRARGTSKRT